MIQTILNQIEAYIPSCAQEEQDKKNILLYIATFDDLLTRDNTIVHITSSPWIVNQDFTKVLMVYHNVYQSWSWCGGHADGNPNLLQVALKEAKEETGIQQIHPFSDAIFAIDILPVFHHSKHGEHISSHMHINVCYLCITDEKEKLQHKPDENSDVKWFSIEEVLNVVEEKPMREVYHKLIKQVQSL